MNIQIGYATILATSVTTADGKTKPGWVLPGGVNTTCIEQARRAAEIIDQVITKAVIARQAGR